MDRTRKYIYILVTIIDNFRSCDNVKTESDKRAELRNSVREIEIVLRSVVAKRHVRKPNRPNRVSAADSTVDQPGSSGI